MAADGTSPGNTLDSPASAGLHSVPLFHAAWLFAAGIMATHWMWMRPSFTLVALALVAVVCAVAALRAQRVLWVPVAALWLLLGAWTAEMEPQPAPAPALVHLSDGLLRTVEGTVVDAAPARSAVEQNAGEGPLIASTQRIDLRTATLEEVSDDVDRQVTVDGGVRLTVRWPDAEPSTVTGRQNAQPFRCGERIRAVVRLLPPETYHDPGVWSRADYLLDEGVTASSSVSLDRVERLGQSRGLFFACRLRGWQHSMTARLLALPAAMQRFPAPLRLSQDDAIMLAAMVAGDRTYLTHALRVGFERTGSFHMLVVSGFHLAIVAGGIFWLARRLRVPRVPATLVTIAASFGYAFFTGFATPVQRSLWMVTLYLLGRLVYRERSPLNVIGFAALCLLVASPRSVFDSSFQMTLLAVVAIAGIALPLLRSTIYPYVAATRDLGLIALDVKLPPLIAAFRVALRMTAAHLQRAIDPGARAKRELPRVQSDDNARPQVALVRDTWSIFVTEWRAAIQGRLARSMGWTVYPWVVRSFLRLIELILLSFMIELAMTLPMAVYFHRITIFALPVNLLILPLLAVLMPIALLTLLALLVWPAMATIPAAAVALVLHFGVGLVHLFGSMALGDFRIASPLLWQSAAFCLLLAAAIALAHLGMRLPWLRRAAWAALLLAGVAAVVPRPVERPRNALLVEAIDVGQGDSLLLITPDGKTLLVDAGGFGGGPGETAPEFDIGEEVVSPTLWARGIRTLDAVALSHAHSDHMGGMAAVLRNFRPRELWIGNNPHFAAYDAMLEEAANLHVQVRSFRAGDAFAFGGTQIEVLAPFRDYQPGAEPANNDSLVLHVAYGATSVMLEGDAEEPIEQAMLAEPDLQSTLLKVGHHGSTTSTRPEFLARVAPQWAVISCGFHNRYGHPRPEVLEELEAAHARTLRTDANGASCFVLDGKAVTADYACGWRDVSR